jgi:hypothetical protein
MAVHRGKKVRNVTMGNPQAYFLNPKKINKLFKK